MTAVTTAQALAVADDVGIEITPAALRKWVQRGKVRHYGHDAYDIDDIAREIRRIAATRAELT